MTTVLLNLWGSVSYVGAVIAACVLVSSKLERKPHYGWKMAAYSILILALSYALEELVGLLTSPSLLRQGIRTLNCAAVFLATMMLVKGCHRCSFWQALFCATTGYCLEHLSNRLYGLTVLWLPERPPFPADALLVLLMRALIYLPMYLLVIRRTDMSRIETDNKVQTAAALIIVTFAIVVSSFSSMFTRGIAPQLQMTLHLYSCGLCVMGLFVELYQISYQRMKSERDVLKQLIYQEAAQYQREKDTIDVIKVKYHDLKHQLHILEDTYGKDKMKDLRQAVNGYDSFFRTGSIALDTVLAMKNFTCISKEIQFTCMADGEKIGMLSEVDIYSLFGNILDNAIEAVETLPVEKRIISLNVFARSGFVFIHCENYCTAQPLFVDGLPQTTKADKDYHGYGSHSLRMLAEKYNGNCTFSAEEAVFNTDIVLPLQ